MTPGFITYAKFAKLKGPGVLIVHRIHTKDLSEVLINQWRSLRNANPSLESPFFCPEFFLALGKVRSDIEVLVVEENGTIVGFLPFVAKGFYARPVPMCSYQGLITRSDLSLDVKKILRLAKLQAWDFSSLIMYQANPLTCRLSQPLPSRQIDLTSGAQAFEQTLRKASPGQYRNTFRCMRKITRDLGPVNFVFNDNDPRLLEKLLHWKAHKYNDQHATEEWRLRAFKEILNFRGASFAGVISSLRAGDHLLTICISVRAGNLLHSIFSAYDEKYTSYAPGIIFWLQLACKFAELGGKKIDLGTGEEAYKKLICNKETYLVRGTCEIRTPRVLARRVIHKFNDLTSRP
jgi:CelD/BcsL family acetyltransferase involved in cellulose biosynthesis